MVSAVHLFLIQDDQVLLARRFNTGYEDGKFSVPAGHVDENESCIQAMIREAKEEITIDINAKDLTLAHVMHRRSNRESIDFFFVCKNWQGIPIINEPDKCDAIDWFDLSNLPENTIPYIRHAVSQHLDRQVYSEFGW